MILVSQMQGEEMQEIWGIWGIKKLGGSDV